MPRALYLIFHAARHAKRRWWAAKERGAPAAGAYLDDVVAPLWRYMFSRTYAGLAVKGATSRPTLKEDVSYVTDQHYDDVDEQLMTRRRLRALVVRADAGAGRTTITEFMQIVDLPAHTWYDLLRAPASRGALREFMFRRGNVAHRRAV